MRNEALASTTKPLCQPALKLKYNINQYFAIYCRRFAILSQSGQKFKLNIDQYSAILCQHIAILCQQGNNNWNTIIINICQHCPDSDNNWNAILRLSLDFKLSFAINVWTTTDPNPAFNFNFSLKLSFKWIYHRQLMIPHKLENYYLYAKSKIQFNGKYNILENTVSCISNS